MRLKMMAVSFTALALLVPAHVTAGPTASTSVKATETDDWTPTKVRITKGDRVVWKNPTFNVHTIKPYKKAWMSKKTLYPDEKAAKRFRKTGRYYYRCTFHSVLTDGECSGMCGLIRVTRPQ